MRKKSRTILSLVLVLICLFIFTQICLRVVENSLNGLDSIVKMALLTHFTLLYKPLLGFISAQIFLYALTVYFLWYILLTLSDLFSLTASNTKLLSIGVTSLTIVFILMANTYYVSHSFFASLVGQNFFKGAVNYMQLKSYLIYGSIFFLILLFLTALALLKDLRQGQHRLRHITLLCILFSGTVALSIPTLKLSPSTNTTFNKPHIFIIGFDAIRPDFLGYFKQTPGQTPQFDAFLNSAIVFKESYTPLARTFPSWATILTSQYPSHTKVREDNSALSSLSLDKTLAQELKAAGYTTIYASDDNRFSYLETEFGFDHHIGGKGGIVDYMMGIINDFPLSNLLVPTKMGKLLFPYQYGSHSAAFTHDPNNFLDLIQDKLAHLNTQKPIFLAVHFNVSAFPWQSFNDQLSNSSGTLDLYKNALQKADATLGVFLDNLKEQGLLNHALVILLSDHGITLALPGDRQTREERYVGDRTKILLKRTRYITSKRMDPKNFKLQNDNQLKFSSAALAKELFGLQNYGLDSSYAYGGDVLSLKQNQALLAFKGYWPCYRPCTSCEWQKHIS